MRYAFCLSERVLDNAEVRRVRRQVEDYAAPRPDDLSLCTPRALDGCPSSPASGQAQGPRRVRGRFRRSLRRRFLECRARSDALRRDVSQQGHVLAPVSRCAHSLPANSFFGPTRGTPASGRPSSRSPAPRLLVSGNLRRSGTVATGALRGRPPGASLRSLQSSAWSRTVSSGRARTLLSQLGVALDRGAAHPEGAGDLLPETFKAGYRALRYVPCADIEEAPQRAMPALEPARCAI